MEVEVKLRLPDSAAHQRLSDALSAHHVRTLLQENFFFDGPTDELAARFAAFRLRFYGGDARCVLSLKARPLLSNGISRVEEDEEDLDPALGRSCLVDPSRLLSLADASRIVRRVADEFKVASLVYLGGFKNVRAVYEWKEGLVIELDETQFEFGTSYEVECETSEPERTKELLEGLMREAGVPYAYSEASKFAVFRAGRLLP